MIMDLTGDKMIELLVKKGVHIFNPTQEILDKVNKDLVFKNPQYENAKKYGKYAAQYLSPLLYFFSYNEEKNILYIPRGYVFYIIQYLKENKIPYKITDKTTLHPNMQLSFNGNLRDYQMKAIADVVKYPVGVLESGTGSGKTVMGIKLIELRKQPTMIIVHTKELLNQWDQRIRQFLNYEPGLVGGGKDIVKPITIGIVQSVQNRIDDLKDKFGHVICDECHRVSSSTWTDVMSQFSAKYYLGLSATAYRSDGLGHAIYAFIGPKAHTVDKETLHEVGAVLKPVIVRVPTQFYEYYTGDYSSIVGKLVADEERNKLIARTVQQDIKQFNSAVLIASDRVNHCHAIQDELEKLNIASVVLTAATKAKDRKAIVEGMNTGRYKVLISTMALIGEGFDCPGLHGLFIVSPIKYPGKVLQVSGRVLRPEKGKTARIYDFRDDNIQMLKGMGKKRDKVYKVQWGL